MINRKTVLTASHCNVDIFDYEHDGETFKVPVEANEFYPTRASMMTVYVGVHNRTSMKTWPAKSYSVSNVISVIVLVFIFNLKLLEYYLVF